MAAREKKSHGWRRRTAVAGALLLVAPPILLLAAFKLAVWFWPYPAGADRPSAASRLLLDRSGAPLAAFVSADGNWQIPLREEQISPHLLNAIVAIEDARFYQHSGVDWKSVAAAAATDLRNLRIRRGASTITMQLQRLRQPRSRTLFNKFEQAVRAVQLDCQLTKRQVLVEYLNRAPFARNLVGAGAASWRYFGKPCAQLSLGQAALLAGLPQSPSRLRPDCYPQHALARRQVVLDRMLALRMIDAHQHDEASAEPIDAAWRRLPQEPLNAPVAHGALALLERLARQHRSSIEHTTLDASLQQMVGKMALDHLRQLRPSGINAAAVVVLETKSAQCLVSVSLCNDAAAHIDLTARPRSTGSALKPLIYAAAFDAGICTPLTVLNDSPAAWPGYAPADYDHQFRGPMTAAEALAESRNIPAMLVLAKVGVSRATGLLDSAGLVTLARSSRPYGVSLAVGGAEATPLELAQAYAALGRGGLARKVQLTISDAEGSAAASSARLLSPVACWQTLAAISSSDRTRAVCPEAVRTHVAWKTGTSSGHRDAWCAAVTAQHTVVVWLGNPRGEASPALIGQEAAAPLALRLIAALDSEGGPPWPTVTAAADTVGTAARSTPVQPLPRQGRLVLISPVESQELLRDPSLPRERQRVLLKAALIGSKAGDPYHAPLWWFVDGQPLKGPVDGAEWWDPTPGRHEIRAMDESGRVATVNVSVR